MRREKPDFVQVNYSLADRSVEQGLLSVARDTGTAVLINMPFGRGRLFNAVRGRLPDTAMRRKLIGFFAALAWIIVCSRLEGGRSACP